MMKRNKLLKKLEAIRPAVSTKEEVSQVNCFVFSDGYAYSYDDRITMRTVLDIGFEGAVLAKPLLSVLAKAPSPDIEIKQKKNELVVRSGGYKAGIKCFKEIELPIDDIDTPEKWIKLPKGFMDAVAKVLPSVGTDFSKPVLCNVYISDEGYIAASDNYRVSYVKMDGLPYEILIPSASCKALLDLKYIKYIGMEKGSAWVHFWSGKKRDPIFSCRRFIDNFPDISFVYEREQPTDSFVLPDISKALDRAGIFIGKDIDASNTIRVAVSKDHIIINGRGEEGWFKERIEIDEALPSFKFYCHPLLLKDLIKGRYEVDLDERGILYAYDENFIHAVTLSK